MENLIVDGDFENLYTGTSWTALTAGLGGWRIGSGRALEIGAETIYRGGQGDRNNAIVELDYDGAQNSIYQDVQTVAGQVYTLNFDSALRAGTGQATNTIEVYWNGARVATIESGSTNWQANSLQLTGTGGTNRLEFREPAGDSNGLGALIDNVQLFAGAMTTLNGTVVNNVITGTGANEIINGLAGNDSLNGAGGNDVINAGEGNDQLRGSTGNDYLDGGTGTDTALFAGVWQDYAVVGFNDNGSIVYRDNNLANGNEGTDTLSNIEWIRQDGGGLWEVQLAGAGNDVLTSRAGQWDIMNGGAGNDTITGGNGNDYLGGASGNDAIRGGAGNDTIDGGIGTDTAYFSGVWSNYVIDAMNDDGSIVYRDNNLADGNDGSDTLSNIEWIRLDRGGLWETQLGGAGNDVLTSQAAQWDIINGGAGNDTITGGGGNDFLGGAAGDDIINGAGGTDTAIYANDIGSYQITQNANGAFTIVGEGTDTVSNVERFQFNGETFSANQIVDISSNLIRNGDFEGLTTARWSQSQTGFGAWQIGGTPGTVGAVPTNPITPNIMEIGQENAYIGGNNSGNYIAEINGGRYSQDAIYQEVQTVAGQTYQLTFDAATRTNLTEEDGRFDVFWNDQLIGTVEPQGNNFEGFTFHVTGTGGQDRLTFQESMGNINARTTGGILDNVSLVAINANEQQITGDEGVDTIVGRDSADQINGGAGNDYLFGEGGNDIITAGTGRTLIDGGEGTDTAVIDANRADFRVGLDGDGGVLLYQTVSGMRVAQHHLVDIENVRFNDGTVSIQELTQNNNRFMIADDSQDLVIGSENSDVIFGGVQGHNIIMGLGGNDLLIASGGKDDILIGGEGNDVLEGGLSEGVFFDGGAGNDTIRGSTGNDLVLFTGEGGNDTFVGNGGNDIIIVTDEFGSSIRALGNLQFNLTQGTATQATVGNNYTVFNFSANAVGTLTYTDDSGDESTLNFRDVDQLNLGIDVNFGTAENTFTPVSGLGDILVSGPQRFDDYIQYGGDGDDSLFGATPGRDLLIGGDGDDFATGFVGDDYIFGGRGNDELHGRSEDDYLDGGEGNDLLNGWEDNDTLIGGQGNDIIDGGDGTDIAVFSGSIDQYTISSNADGSITVASNGANQDGTDTLTTVELLQFGDNEAITVAEALGNSGGNNNDVLNGTANGDTIDGGAGNDTINGLAGNDTLLGGAGNDTINAGDGWDFITGGTGDDVLTGGDLGDTFFFTEDNGDDILTDFEAGIDLLDFSDVANALGDLTITQNGNNTVITFADGSVTLQGFDGNFVAGDVVIDGDIVI